MEISVWTCCFDIFHHSALFFQPFIYHFFSLRSANFVCQWNLAFLLNIYWGHQEISIEYWDHIKTQFNWLAKIHIFLLFLPLNYSIFGDRSPSLWKNQILYLSSWSTFFQYDPFESRWQKESAGHLRYTIKASCNMPTMSVWGGTVRVGRKS